MFLIHAILALLFAALAVAVLTAGLRLRPRHMSASAFFVMLFLATWAGGIWLEPFGPPMGTIYWLPFILITILLAILLVVVLPPQVRNQAIAMEREDEVEAGLGVFFWVLVGALATAIALRYFR